MLTERTFRPSGYAECQYGLSSVMIGDQLTVAPDLDREGCSVLLNYDGDAVGYLSARHWVTIDLKNGRKVLHASVTGSRGEASREPGLTVRVVTGDAGDKYPAWTPPQRQTTTHQLQTPVGNFGLTIGGPRRRFAQNIVGESFRQAQIARTMIGEVVRLIHDPANDYDARAIAVLNAREEQVGFLPRGGWLTRALLDDQALYSAKVLEIHRASAQRPYAAVILDVILGQPDVHGPARSASSWA